MQSEAGGHEYGEAFVKGLEWMWGEGFLSPGGPQEVAEILKDADIGGARVLDIGCGLGGVDLLLVRAHGAGQVVGIDVEPALLARARAAAAAAGLSRRLTFRQVAPGPLPLEDEAFDVVFSKDSMIHIPDKAALYGEVLRVLRPGGRFLASDWLKGGRGPTSKEMADWLAIVGLSFEMADAAQTERALSAAGFVEVRLRDRNAWYREAIKDELARVSGANHAPLIEAIGAEAAAQRVASTSAKKLVIDRGELRPTHIHAAKPG